MKTSQLRDLKAFSLIEVVVAVGIFALAIVGVIGLLTPTNKAVADVADTDAASRVISSLQFGLQQAGFTAVQSRLVADTAILTNEDYIFAASKSGDKVGLKLGEAGTPFEEPGEQFFEFALIRNTTLSPAGNDATAGFLAFTISLRWPAFLPNGAEFTVNEQKSVMIIPAAITR